MPLFVISRLINTGILLQFIILKDVIQLLSFYEVQNRFIMDTPYLRLHGKDSA